MTRKSTLVVLVVLLVLIVVNLVGIAIPVWYHKEHQHSINNSTNNSTSGTSITINTNLASALNSDTTSKPAHNNQPKDVEDNVDTTSVVTDPSSDDVTIIEDDSTPDRCVVHMHILEGLWQRHCIETHREGRFCEVDIQEWCDNLQFSEYNSFVLGTQILGDIILLFALLTIVRALCKHGNYNIEMVGSEIGIGGILMILGVMVYAAADTGELGYQARDLHVGWGLCVGGGAACFLLAVYCMCRHVYDSSPRIPSGYFPINDDDLDDELLQLDGSQAI
ncbi:uncharacterized protein LOC128238375 isoform X2 [Mya arenaria]|nr:uncharacterized protein LOC128238375 isoform X2 [Mya arenaria]